MAMTRGTVRSGDLIDIYIADEPEFSGQFPVSADGKIKMPYLGVIAVAGKSTEQVARIIADKGRKYLVDPVVVVSIVGGTSALVHIMGEVPRQGPVPLDEAPNLLSLLAASGGVTPTGDLSQIVIVRGKQRIRVPADVEGGVDFIPANVPLSEGDMVIVPRKPEKMVFVTGAVQRPGFVPIEQANTCTRAFILAGGGVSGAALSRSYILRGPERIEVDLTRLLDGSADTEDVAMQDKDVLVIPLASSETGVGAPEVAIVAGAVLTPGAMPLAQVQSAARAVTLAGGLAPTANPSASYILRDGTRIDADLQAILRGTSEDIPLKANDILVVPSLPIDSVYVVGAVASPGPRLMTWADTLAKAVTFAGGPTPLADQTQCYILRGKETIPFDLGALMRGGAGDVALEANDLIVVPPKTPERLQQEQWERSVVVAGAVAQPTRVPLAQADSLMRVLVYAGGVTPMADLAGVQVLRGAERIRLDITDLMTGKGSDDIIVQPGDLVIVPTKSPDQVAQEQLARMALIAGAVNQPQLVPIVQVPTVRRAVVFAGGTAPNADLEGSYILRGEQLVYVDLGAIMNGEAEDVPLQAGDLLVVPILTMERAMARQAAVTGAVMQPRPAPLSQARTVSRAIIYAGGPAPNADLSAAYILRGSDRISVDGEAAISGSGPDPELRPGDMLVVPQISQLPVVIVGAVRQASAQPANMADSVAKAVTLAGGLLPTADGKRGYVLRDGTRIDVDIPAILAGGEDFPLKPSDLLVVPTMTAANQMAASILVMGAVARPGMIPAELAATARQAVLLAGGFTTNANPAQCQLLRRELSSEVDLEAVMSGSQPDFAVGGGDVLIVPDKADAMVYVAGAVTAPGPQAHHWSNSVSRALALASPAPQADLERTYVLRGATRVDIDALRILHGEEADFDLQPDDLIVVPLRSPEADLASRARESVTIAGAVARPGLFAPEQCDTVARAMAWVGGPTPQADLEHAYVLRGKETISLNLAQLGSEGGPDNVALQANDILVVPVLTPEMLAAQEFSRRIMVSGAVPQPGMLLHEQAGTVNAALAMAGGVTEAADLEGAYVLREGIRHDINLKAIRNGTAPDFSLQPRDVLVVPPRVPEMVMVAGAVRAPGRVPLDQAGTVLSALTVSGGAAEAADLQAAFIVRDGERVPVNLRAVIAGESEDLALQADDVLMVPAADPDPVYVIGNVKAPGAHPITRAVTASKALVLSGGPIDLVSDLRGAYIMRGSERIPVDLDAVINRGQADADVPLLANDALVVPKAEENFHVIGEVKQPGSYLLTQADTVLAALAIAGGTLPTANLEAATLLRDGQTIPLDLRALLDNRDYATNLELQAGDSLVIPLSKARVFVFGSVGRPGAYPLQPGDTYLDLIAHAGGLSGQSRVDRIWIVRAARQNPVPETSGTSGDKTASASTTTPAPRTAQPSRTRREEQAAGEPSIHRAFGGAPSHLQPPAPRDGSVRAGSAQQGAPVRVKDRYSITELTRLDATSYAGTPQDGDLIYVPGPKERKQNLLDWLLNIGVGRLLFND
ncbi:MAG: SLBB domain-containing protein [Armatimonadetes bacterium]|nr:SLBB domain-containing protein [Armatimonadota bacterium]